MRFRHTAGASLLLLAFAADTSAQSEVTLPRMGDPADQILSPAEERELGESFMRYVAARSTIVEDALLNDYLSALGARLVSASESRNGGFTFFLVDEPAINAFAAPGGFIGVNSGLMLASANESQLAGVLAHEIAHVTQRHIARAYANSRTSALPTAAAILAAILLGGQNPQASQAALATGIAAAQQWQLNYTRANEYEADRLGIQVLANAGFDPQGMVDFFTLLERKHASDGVSLPEYLSTHPLGGNRVAEARNRAAGLAQPAQRRDSGEFQQARARLTVLSSKDLHALDETLASALPTAQGPQRNALAYAQALVRYELDDFAGAGTLAAQLVAAAPDDLYYNLLLADIHYAAGRLPAGAALFDQLAELYPGSIPVLLHSAAAAEGAGELERATRALRDALRSPGTHRARTYRTLARVEDRRGRTAASLEALAEYQALAGEEQLAIRHLEQALKQLETGGSAALRIEARLQQLRDQLARKLRQRGGG